MQYHIYNDATHTYQFPLIPSIFGESAVTRHDQYHQYRILCSLALNFFCRPRAAPLCESIHLKISSVFCPSRAKWKKR